MTLCRRRSVPFLINDDVDLAVEAGADGIHVGQHDMEAGRVRARIGPDMILGVSVQTVEQALAAQAAGTDYLGVGAVFPTGTKEDADAVSYAVLREICRAADIPVVAIGGITRDNILELKNCGLDGAAVVSALFAQPDVRAAAEELRRLCGKIAEED